MPESSYPDNPIIHLEVYDPDTGDLNTTIETPKGFRNKYKFDPNSGLFRLSGVLPSGAVFPFDFGFIPSTLGEDGDFLDVLVLMDEPAYTGCLITTRLVGVIEAEQTEKSKKKERNDRLIAIASKSHRYQNVKKLNQLGIFLLDEIEHFFISYNETMGRKFVPLRRADVPDAKKIIAKGIKAFKKQE